jgi:hypothetical protein
MMHPTRLRCVDPKPAALLRMAREMSQRAPPPCCPVQIAFPGCQRKSRFLNRNSILVKDGRLSLPNEPESHLGYCLYRCPNARGVVLYFHANAEVRPPPRQAPTRAPLVSRGLPGLSASTPALLQQQQQERPLLLHIILHHYTPKTSSYPH